MEATAKTTTMTIGRLALRDDGEGPSWMIPTKDKGRIAEQARGMVVTVGYDLARVAGRVTNAYADGIGIVCEVELADDVPAWVLRRAETPYALRLGPSLLKAREEDRWDLKEVTILPPVALVVPEVQEVRRVALGPEDRLVIQIPAREQTVAQLDGMKDQLAEVFGIDRHRVLIVLGEAALSVVGPEDREFEAFRGGFEAVYDGDADDAAIRASYDEWVNRHG